MLKKLSYFLAVTLCAGLTLPGCSSGESYAKLLEDENKSVNRFLADHIVCATLPENSDFKVGTDAPYYVIDDENGVYMQVLDKGDMDDRVVADQEVFFRYSAASLLDYSGMDALSWGGNADNLALGNYSFRYENYSIPSSYQWGTGIQQPLRFLGFGCRVNLVVKSVSGFTDLQSQCVPYLFNISYHKSRLTGE